MKYLLLVVFGLFSTLSFSQFWDISSPVKLPGTVNTVSSEESIPVFSKDSSILYFVRTYDPNAAGGEMDQDIWYSRKDSKGNYGDCELLSEVNNKYHNAVLGIGGKSNRMYLLNSYEGKKDKIKGLAVSENKGNKWSYPIEISIPGLDIEGDYYGFFVNESEDVIIISYQGSESLGLEDLYVSTKSSSGWSNPIHLGKNINSNGFEISPFLCKTQDTLFFSSNGFGGEGDADIFYSVKQGSWTDWSKPTNMGKKINSPKFDAYFSHTGSTLYWSSNRDQERSDIYMARALTPPPISIACSGKDVTIFNGSDGLFNANITGGVEPIAVLWSNGSKDLKNTNAKAGTYLVTATDAIGQQATCSVTLFQPELVVNKPIVLPEVRYVFNKWTFVTDSTIHSLDSIEYVYNLLIDNPKLVLELSSHTDARGSDDANQKLSENRARAMYKYLVEEKGIDARRIVPVGKGEKSPRTVYLRNSQYFVSQPADMNGVQTIVLTESYINKFKETDRKLFEQLHQLNRRTEGKVINQEFDPLKAPPAKASYSIYVPYP
jgi:outer membrane protein OmpA-like peptidoglycan-associated protein